MKKLTGITVAGNVLVDFVKMIESYPEKGMLVTIENQSLAVGGCVPNTAIDLKKLDSELVVNAVGLVGKDEFGSFVKNYMLNVGVDVSGINTHPSSPTGYSDVMTVKSTGERTFFHNRGANKYFSSSDVDVDNLDCKIFHAGYLMLLDSLDKLGENGKTQMSELLAKIRTKGIATSIDLVSESSGDFKKIVRSALPYTDYVIINEIEAGNVAGISPRDKDGKVLDDNVLSIMKTILDMGVNQKVIVHCPEKGYCLSKNGEFTISPSIKLPKGFIKGSVGAGDAFCAGCLYAIYNDYNDSDMLEFANLVAVNCLSSYDSVSGVKNKDKLRDCLN